VVDLPGTRIGRYRILEILGSGGFSTVYRAIDEQLDAEVALKVLAENHALDPDVRERFLSEAQLLRRIQNPGVVAVHDVGETDRRQPYLVMDLAAGGDLGTRLDALDAGGPSPGLSSGRDLTRSRYRVQRDEILAVAQALATSLGRAHDLGVVHRDVKPANLLLITDTTTDPAPADRAAVLIGPGDRVVLADLGLAKDLEANSGLTVAAGTRGFAAPEQLTPNSTVTRAVDIHAASAVIFWLLTREIPTTESAWTQIPDGLEPALRKGLTTSPNDRFATMSEWSDAIRAPLGVIASGAGRRDATRRRRALPLVLVGLLVLLAAAGTAGFALASTGGDQTQVEVDSDGIQRVQASRAGVELTIVGPAQATVGQEVHLQATTTSGTELVWIVPSGETAIGGTLQLTARRSGTAIITVATGIEDDQALLAEFELDVGG
jgi:serine/threonine protein kinase